MSGLCTDSQKQSPLDTDFKGNCLGYVMLRVVLENGLEKMQLEESRRRSLCFLAGHLGGRRRRPLCEMALPHLWPWRNEKSEKNHGYAEQSPQINQNLPRLLEHL